MKTPDEIKKGLGFCAKPDHPVINKCEFCTYGAVPGYEEALKKDVLAYIQQLEEDKKRLQERICNQRRQLRVLHAMYEWALSVLQKAHMNDRAKLQAWLRKRGYELDTFELPESKYQQLERERDAAVEDCIVASEDYADLYWETKRMKAAAPKWISVEEQAEPSQDGVYLCCGYWFRSGREQIETAEYLGEWKIENNFILTHWMKLPEPPKEEA